MGSSEKSKVFMFDGDDPEMLGANEKARQTFRYFWRELAWERRRIVPGLDLACIKAPFSDGPGTAGIDGKPKVEQMWINQVDFDGKLVRGVLLNSPNWLKSVKAGDKVALPLARVADWMYAMAGQVYGAYTVNLMRSRMNSQEREAHDKAWGRNFGDPNSIRIVPPQKKAGGILGALFGGRGSGEEIGEHPMSENMGPSFRKTMAESPKMVDQKDPRGWTWLHHQSLAGSYATVKVLLEFGADTNALTPQGMTALQLAQTLGWQRVIELLAAGK